MAPGEQSKIQFYKRVLPKDCTSFSCDEGKKLFTESLLSGYANIYFPLAEQFRTQEEPAYCGMSTLVMVLNALAVDPKKIWKGPWRWYHEDMLDCCVPLDLIQQEGITMEQFGCLALCNNLDLAVTRIDEKLDVDKFRDIVKEVCIGEANVLVCSYSRELLGQTGDGHYSPIGAYHPQDDKVLILDVARFKYPPHWVSVEQMWKSMKGIDKATGLPRGYFVMKKAKESPLILFRLSHTFRATIASDKLSDSAMTKFLKSWKNFLEKQKSSDEKEYTDLTDLMDFALTELSKSLLLLAEGELVFTTQFNTCCMEALPKEHMQKVRQLLNCIEKTDIYKFTGIWLTKLQNGKPTNNDQKQNLIDLDIRNIKSSHVWSIKRIGNSVGQSDRTQNVCVKSENASDSSDHFSHNISKYQPEENLVRCSHYLTMFLLCWPYESENLSNFVIMLINKVEKCLQSSCWVLSNEVNKLRHQILSLLSMIS